MAVVVAVAGVITVPCGDFGTDSPPYPPRALSRAPSTTRTTSTTTDRSDWVRDLIREGLAILGRSAPSLRLPRDYGNLFVADSGNHTIRNVVIAGGTVTSLAGFAGTAGSAGAPQPAPRCSCRRNWPC